MIELILFIGFSAIGYLQYSNNKYLKLLAEIETKKQLKKNLTQALLDATIIKETPEQLIDLEKKGYLQ